MIDEKVLYEISETGMRNALRIKKVKVTQPKPITFFTVREYVESTDSYGRGINLAAEDIAEVIKGLYKTFLEEELGEPADLLSQLSGMRQTRRLRRKTE